MTVEEMKLAFAKNLRTLMEAHDCTQEDIAKVFSRFWRSDVSRERAAGGLGVGLAITKEIVDQHNGTIAIQSELGKGTTFTVVLPLTRREQREA